MTVLTIKQVAEKLQVSTDTVYKLIHAKGLPAIPIGSHFRVTSEALDTWLAGDHPQSEVAVEEQAPEPDKDRSNLGNKSVAELLLGMDNRAMNKRHKDSQEGE